MKSEKELNALKNEVETLNSKLRELTEEELEQVTGGIRIALREKTDEARLKRREASGVKVF